VRFLKSSQTYQNIRLAYVGKVDLVNLFQNVEKLQKRVAILETQPDSLGGYMIAQEQFPTLTWKEYMQTRSEQMEEAKMKKEDTLSCGT